MNPDNRLRFETSWEFCRSLRESRRLLARPDWPTVLGASKMLAGTKRGKLDVAK